MTAPARPRRARRTRQRCVDPDGVERTQSDPPRPDVLWYPLGDHSGIATVLVRRTHDPILARVLAEQRWAEIGESAPLVRSRFGWWATLPRGARLVRGDAYDPALRVVRWTTVVPPSGLAIGPGVEFRP